METNATASRRIRNLANHIYNSTSAESISCSCCSSLAECECKSSCKSCKCEMMKQNTLGMTNCSANENILDIERKNASFKIRELTYVLDGGKEATEMKELMATLIENDPILREENRFDQTRPESRQKTMEKVKRVIEMMNISQQTEIPKVSKQDKKRTDKQRATAEAFWYMMATYDPSWATRIGVHFGLFLNAIQGQGTEEQKQKYVPLAQTMRIIGCYAMTEMGHGSFIQGFETTATYDKSSKEFIINSPTETSTKWWIGMAGQTATHTVAFARLIIDGKDYGVHSFIVPLRSIETGEALPGISVGDCGAKMGRNGLDNGWIQFHNVRVPRENMLMKWAQVSPDGQYTKPPKAQLSYGALIGGRVSMVQDASDYAKKGLTIAIRYSAVRRQFLDSNGKQEQQILNYQSHQFRLMPLLATCYAFHFTAQQVTKKFESLQEELEKGDISNLVGVHATSAGLKAFCTWWCNEALEQSRQCLGGHGYSAYSALPSFLQDYAVMCSWEGDNTVMAQQLAKFLMKCLKNAKQGQKLSGFERYLSKFQKILREKRVNVMKPSDLLNPDIQLRIIRRLALVQIVKANDRLTNDRAKGRNKTEAWNDCMVDLIRCAKMHSDYFIMNCFVEAIEALPKSENGVREVLKKLSDLHALITIDKYFGYALEDRYMNSKQVEMMHTLIRTLCKEVRKDAVPLVDAFNIPDFILNSPLGRYDGNVYSHYLDTVKKAPNAIGKAPYWDSTIQPLLSGKTEE